MSLPLPPGAVDPADQPPPPPVLGRVAFVGRVLRLIVYPLATVVLGHLVLFNVEQAQEVIQATLDDGISSRLVWYAVGYFAWGLSAWYAARLLLCKRWAAAGQRRRPWGRSKLSDPVGLCVSARWALFWVTWTPRVLALATALPSALLMWWRQQWLAAGFLTAGALLLLFGLVFRRRLGLTRLAWQRRYQQVVENAPFEQWARFDHISASGKVLLLLLALAPWLVIVVGVLGDQSQLAAVARHVGAPGLVLLALSSFNVVGSMLLVYAPQLLGWGSFAWVPTLFWLCFSSFNENHQVAKRSEIPPPQSCPRPVSADFAEWLARRRVEGRAEDPIYLVTMSGGASRAAFWGAYTMAWLDDVARGRQRPFLANVYAVSGVSGGSLGAATVVGALASSREFVLKGGGGPAPALSDWVSDVLARDHLSPVMQSLLSLDFLARLSPVPVQAVDRSHALERTWESDTDEVARQRLGGMATTSWFRLPMESLYAADTDQCPSAGGGEGTRCLSRLPRLILNATSAETGEPVLQTALDLHHPLAIHVRDRNLGLAHLTLSEAVHNSARFPYVSPAGQVLAAESPHSKQPVGCGGLPPPKAGAVGVDYWVDGGYYENSGAWSMQVLLRTLAKSPELTRDALAWRDVVSRLRVIVFSNEPVEAGSPVWLPPVVDPVGAAGSQGLPSATVRTFQRQSSWLIEVIGPGKGLYATRSARANAETFRLAQLLSELREQVGLPPGPVVHELRLPATTAEAPSMNWYINHRSTCVMRSYLWGRDQCPSANVAPIPQGWDRASGYLRFRGQLTRLMAEIGLPTAGLPVVAPPVSGPTLR